jgi:hypothetical protein
MASRSTAIFAKITPFRRASLFFPPISAFSHFTMASDSPVEKAHDIEKESITSLPAPESGENLNRALSVRQVRPLAAPH